MLGAVRSHPRLTHSPPPCSGGFLARLGWLPRWCLAQIWLLDGLLLDSFAQDLLYAFRVAPFDHIPMYFMNKSCKTLNLQYMWKYVNSKSIYVKSLFISPVLDINWQSDMVVKDRQ